MCITHISWFQPMEFFVCYAMVRSLSMGILVRITFSLPLLFIFDQRIFYTYFCSCFVLLFDMSPLRIMNNNNEKSMRNWIIIAFIDQIMRCMRIMFFNTDFIYVFVAINAIAWNNYNGRIYKFMVWQRFIGHLMKKKKMYWMQNHGLIWIYVNNKLSQNNMYLKLIYWVFTKNKNTEHFNWSINPVQLNNGWIDAFFKIE